MKTRSFFALSLMLLAAGCESDDNRTDRDSAYTAPPANTTHRNTEVISGASSGLSQVDRDFVKDAASAGMFEVQSSQFALQQQGTDPSVMRVAQMMVEDHTRANQELQSIASSKGLVMPQRLNPQHQQMLDRVRSAQGSSFTNQYFQIQTQAHEETIALFQRALQNLNDPDLRQFAQETLPTLQRHLQHVQQYAVGGQGAGYDSTWREPAHQPAPPRHPPYPDAEDTAPDDSPIPPNSPR